MRTPVGFLLGEQKLFVSSEKVGILQTAKRAGSVLQPVWDHPPEMEMDLTWDEFEGMKAGETQAALDALG